MLKRIIVLSVLMLSVINHSICAKTIFVTQQGDDGNAGTSWSSAKRSFSAALDNIASGDQIWIAKGSYDEPIVLTKAVELYGGFVGDETSLTEREKFAEGSDRTNKSSLTKGVRVANTGSQSAIIDSFVLVECGIECAQGAVTITNNSITCSTGAAISCEKSSLAKISNNSIVGCPGISCANCSPDISSNYIDNSKRMDASLLDPDFSGIATVGGSPRITSNRFVKNHSEGVSCQNGSPLISKNTFEDNGWLYSPSPIDGSETLECRSSSIHCSGGQPTVSDNIIKGSGMSGIFIDFCDSAIISGNVITGSKSFGIEVNKTNATISNNTVRNNIGHGIYCRQFGSAVIKSNLVMGNVERKGFDGAGSDQREWDNRRGGGIFCADADSDNASLQISTNTIIGNSAEDGGGIYVTGCNKALVDKNIIDGNTSSRGGGIYFGVGCGGVLSGNVISRNSASKIGGGIYVVPKNGPDMDTGKATIVGNTIVENKGMQDGGGIAIVGAKSAIASNIVAFNSSGIYRSGGVHELCNNCVYTPAGRSFTGISPSASDIQIDPLFVNREKQDYSLAATSPCVDAGSSSFPTFSSFDIDGHARVVGKAIDIGAKECGNSAKSLSELDTRSK